MVYVMIEIAMEWLFSPAFLFRKVFYDGTSYIDKLN